jgi:putative nucleotidyltransferase with HDIG domain
MSKETLLIIAEDSAVRQQCREALASEDYEVITVDHDEPAIKSLLEGFVDLCVIDLELPGMNGLELLERLKGVQPDILPIIITQHLTNENLLRALQLGVKGFLVKPFGMSELLDSIKKILSDHRILKSRIQSHVLNPLFEISESFLSDIDIQDVLRQILAIAKHETGANLVTLIQVDPRSHGLEIVLSEGSVPSDDEAAFTRLQMELANWVTAQKESLIMVEGIEPPIWIQKITAGAGISSSICLPLVRKDKVIGVLHLFKIKNAPSFNQNDLELTTVLCRQAAVLIDNVRLFDEVKRKANDLEEAQFDAIKALAEALETKDAYTRDHSDRAVRHAMAVAEKLGLSDPEKNRLKYAAILHDIGKIGVPEHILNKPAKLTEEEYEIIKSHPEKGAEIIKHIKSLSEIVPLVLYHHQRYDGKGYPTKLSGKDIPIESRIVSVLDAYDAMTSDRVYRNSMGREFAVEELKRSAGIQFDPQVVQAFLEVIKEADESKQHDQHGPDDHQKAAHQTLPNASLPKQQIAIGHTK